MPIFSEVDDKEYRLFSFKTEAEFEKVVEKLSSRIFGDSSIYFNIKKRVNGRDIISIPDAYVLEFADPDDPQLYVIENEIVSHDVYKHVGSQMLRFVVSFEDAQTEIANNLMKEIQGNDSTLKSLEDVVEKSKFRNVDAFLHHAVYSKFRGLVVIDEIRPELSRVIEKIQADIDLIELKSYRSADGTFAYEFNTLYDEESDYVPRTKETSRGVSAAESKNYIERRSKCDTIVVPAQAEGFNRVFLGESHWYAIRIGAAMRDKIKFIAAYQVAPISAVTHIAEVKEIRPYKDSNKFEVIFKGPAREVSPKRLIEARYKPQGPIYVKIQDLEEALTFDDALKKLDK